MGLGATTQALIHLSYHFNPIFIQSKGTYMQIKRRFIAGAKCLKCDAMDRIVMLTTGDAEWIECVECGYSENRPTHIDAPEDAPVADEVGVVQFKPRG